MRDGNSNATPSRPPLGRQRHRAWSRGRAAGRRTALLPPTRAAPAMRVHETPRHLWKCSFFCLTFETGELVENVRCWLQRGGRSVLHKHTSPSPTPLFRNNPTPHQPDIQLINDSRHRRYSLRPHAKHVPTQRRQGEARVDRRRFATSIHVRKRRPTPLVIPPALVRIQVNGCMGANSARLHQHSSLAGRLGRATGLIDESVCASIAAHSQDHHTVL